MVSVHAKVTLPHGLRIEAVSQPADVQEKARACRIGLELPPQTDDVVVDDAVVERDVASPRGIEQLLARQHPPAAPHERREQLELERAQIITWPPRRTSQRAKSTSMSPNRNTSGVVGRGPRRARALMRARSSRGLNGLVT